MAKPRWTRESAIAYLASSPDFSPTKSFDDPANQPKNQRKNYYTTAYLKRQASQLQDAERAGKAAPSMRQRRGHERATITHDRHPQNGLPYWRMEKPSHREIDHADLVNLFKRGYKPRGPKYLITLKGRVKKYPSKTFSIVPEQTAELSRSYWWDKQSVGLWLEKNPQGTAIDLVNAFATEDVEWTEIDAISIVESEGKKSEKKAS